MNKGILIILLGIVLCAFPFLGDGFADDPADSTEQMGGTGSSEEDDNTIESGDSKTSEEKDKEAVEKRMTTMGLISFNPQEHDRMHDNKIGRNQPVYIFQFKDNREAGLDTHIGSLYGMVYHDTRTKLKNSEPVDLSIKNVMTALFAANGFTIQEKANKDDKPLIVKGKINTIWVDLYHTKSATIDIDVQIIDPQSSDILWAGKIAKSKEVSAEGTSAHSVLSGVIGNENELCPFLNSVLAEAIAETWDGGGLRKALNSIASRFEKKKAKEETLKQVARSKPDPKDADSNLKIGIKYYELGQFNEAAKHLERAVNLRPKWARAHYSLGLAFSKSNNKEAAIEQYEILKDLDENYAKKLFDIIHKAD